MHYVTFKNPDQAAHYILSLKLGALPSDKAFNCRQSKGPVNDLRASVKE
jgi:hypothetical protein